MIGIGVSVKGDESGRTQAICERCAGAIVSLSARSDAIGVRIRTCEHHFGAGCAQEPREILPDSQDDVLLRHAVGPDCTYVERFTVRKTRPVPRIDHEDFAV